MSTPYNISVSLTGDSASLQKALQAAAKHVKDFEDSAAKAAEGAAKATDKAAQATEKSAGKTESAARKKAAAVAKAAQEMEQATNREKRSADKSSRAQDEVARKSEETGRKTRDEYRKTADEAERSSSRQVGAAQSIIGTLGRFVGIAGIGYLTKQIWQAGMGFHEFTQNTQIAFETLLGGAGAAKTALADILDFAKQTPYAFTFLTEEAQKLVSAGFQMEEVIPILRSIGDASTAMGRGTEGVQRLSRAFQQIEGKGRLQTEELLQMSELGVNGLKILANQAGMTTLEYQKLVTDGMVPAREAISGLVKGINDGTDGINGQTAAMGGLMEQIKGSGGLTASLDSAHSGFRNMSAELVESLVPAYTSFIRTVTQGMGTVRSIAGFFNDLPGPVKASAAAIAAMTVAHRLFKTQERATAGADLWRRYRAQLDQARLSQMSLTGELSRTRLALNGVRTTASLAGVSLRGAGSALLGFFGGPVGIAITATTAAVAAFAGAQAEARARVDELSRAINTQTGELERSEETLSNIQADLNKPVNNWWTGFWDGSGGGSMLEWAEEMGVSVDDLSAAWAGNDEAMKRVRDTAEAFEAPGWSNWGDKRARFLEELTSREGELSKAQQLGIQNQKIANSLTGDSTDALDDQTAALAEGEQAVVSFALATRQWTEDQQSAIDKARESAKAVVEGFGALSRRSLDVSTEEDLTRALDAVEQANRRVQDAEHSLTQTRGRDKVASHDLTRAEQAVTDARNAAAKATEDLADVEARQDPVEQYRKKTTELLESARTFQADILALADQGLNAESLLDLIAAGPEGTQDARKALLGDSSLIELENEAKAELGQIADVLATAAGVAQADLEAGGNSLGVPIGDGIRIALEDGAHDTISALADALGMEVYQVTAVGREFGLAFLNGMSTTDYDAARTQAAAAWNPKNTHVRNNRVRGYAFGGVLPGYSPGVDNITAYSNIGKFRFSGGESIMRPEFTRALGPGWVHRMNRLAAVGGVAAIRREMGQIRGAFANGGVLPGPQVVTVPVESHHTTNDGPILIGNLNAQDLSDFRQKARQMRGLNNFVGRR